MQQFILTLSSSTPIMQACCTGKKKKAMYKELSAALFFAFVAGAGSTFASGYDDFSRGIDANNRGDSETAIAAFTDAIIATDLARAYLPVAYLGRARADMNTDQCSTAAMDLTEAIRLNPYYLDAYVLRSDANVCLNRPIAALADISTAIGIKPTASFYFSRARQQWSMGRFRQAAADIAEAAKFDPKDPYIVLWVGLLGRRAGNFNQLEFAQRISELNGSSWPAPLLALYRGTADPEDVYRATTNASSIRNANNQRCEADFYVGEWQLSRGNFSTAVSLLKTAVAECPRNFIAYVAAEEELRRSP
ncbi:MAG: hypothetical protein KGJ28_05415 [Alphaproteobacteria bacterium]|nr:hypothetical protein [Alphaproteobacteria bacterium]